MTLKHLSLYTCILLISASCAYKNPEQKEKGKDRDAALASLLMGALIASCDANATAATFSDLAAAGTTSACYDCHGGSSTNAGLDISNYDSVRTRISALDLSNSRLYIQVTTGTMRFYTTTAITTAISNWICSGGPP